MPMWEDVFVALLIGTNWILPRFFHNLNVTSKIASRRQRRHGILLLDNVSTSVSYHIKNSCGLTEGV